MIRIGIARPLPEKSPPPDYGRMGQDELLGLVNTLGDDIVILEKDRQSFKYGTDPEYDEIQRKIEKLQTERGIAYEKWLERKMKK